MRTLTIRTFLLASLLLSGSISINAQNRSLKEQIVSKINVSKAEVAECGGVNKIVNLIKKTDLNKDGKPELIAYFTCSPYVGFFVLRTTTDDVEILYEGGERSDVVALTSYTKGWRNLRLNMYSAGSGESDSVVLRWNGVCYSEPLTPCER